MVARARCRLIYITSIRTLSTLCRGPLITVVMSVYNGARFLDQAIDSIRAQSFRHWEFLITDDGSTDASPEILARHAGQDGRIRVLTQPNRGLIRSLNRGFAEATGFYIARMDADDVSRPYRFEMQLDYLNDHRDISLVGGAIEIVDADNRPLNIIRLPLLPEHLRAHMLEQGNGLAHPTVLFRRLVLQKTGGFRAAYRHAEDYDLWLRMLECFKLGNLSEVVLNYRRHSESVSYKNARQQVLSALCARLTAHRRAEGLGDPTAEVDLITPEVLRSLGVGQDRIDEEIFMNFLWVTEEAVRYGMPLAAVQFSRMAGPHATPERLHSVSLQLNVKAAKSQRGTLGLLKYLFTLLAEDRQTFSAVVRSMLPSPARKAI